MRILVYGAGVLGCNLANNFFRAGKDVTLLARGKWAEEIKNNGLRIKSKFKPGITVSRVPTVTELEPDDGYDVIFVVMRYTQIGAITDILRANKTKNIIFVGNNVRADGLAALLPEKKVMFAFTSAAGHREADRVVSVDLKKVTVGDLRGAPSNEELIGRIFEGTKYRVTYEPNHGRLSSLSRCVRATRGICLLQDRRRSAKAQGRYSLPRQAHRRQHRRLSRDK